MKTFLAITILLLIIGNSYQRDLFDSYGDGNETTTKAKRKYTFYRNMTQASDARRVFGGQSADLSEFPAIAALLDRYWATRCSGSVIASYWALTAAHCVTPRLAYIKYNTRHPGTSDGDFTPVLYLYRHPNYKVVQEDEGRGMDVTLLHHDLGLIRSRDQMHLSSRIPPLSEYLRFNPATLTKAEVMVVGFGRTEVVARSAGEELFSVKLQLVFCDRGAWFHCICGTAAPGYPERGVCSGDSGGPVFYRKIQVGITSMGPLECATTRSEPGEGSTSVFTALYNYIDLINTTILETDQTLKRSVDIMATSTTSIIRLHLAMIAMVILLLLL